MPGVTGVTEQQYLTRNGRGRGSDVIHQAGTAAEQWRLWMEGDLYPRIVLDVPNFQILVGDGTVPPTPLSGGGGGAPVNAHFVTTQAEAGLSQESPLGTLFRADVIANRGAFGIAGQMFFATDTLVGYIDTGSAWSPLLPILGGAGAVTVPQGGTGATSLSGLVKGNGTSPMTAVAAPSGAVVGDTDTQTLTNKRITARVVALTDAATVTPNADTTDMGVLSTLSQNTTLANPTGTPTDGQRFQLRVKSTVARTWTFGSKYRGGTGVPLPSATSGGGLWDYYGWEYNLADDKWDLLAKSPGY